LLETLVEFFEYHISHVLKVGENAHALAGLCELRRIYFGLSTVYPEFKKDFEALDKGMDRLLVTLRSKLMQDYVRSIDPELINELADTLGEIITRDRTWNWQAEFDALVAPPPITPAA
jgi:hypothetical protein